jgi:hypothetical protein
VNEGQWLSATHLRPMLDFLRGKATDRQLRLFACALARRLWDRLTVPERRRAVETAERFADGATTSVELGLANQALHALPFCMYAGKGKIQAALVAFGCTESSAAAAALRAAQMAAYTALRYPRQAAILRCIVGNPFRPLPSRTFPAHVIGLAQSIYTAFPAVSEDYAILADALEELGEPEAAAHCRQELHAKGCHIVDWITGRT